MLCKSRDLKKWLKVNRRNSGGGRFQAEKSRDYFCSLISLLVYFWKSWKIDFVSNLLNFLLSGLWQTKIQIQSISLLKAHLKSSWFDVQDTSKNRSRISWNLQQFWIFHQILSWNYKVCMLWKVITAIFHPIIALNEQACTPWICASSKLLQLKSRHSLLYVCI